MCFVSIFHLTLPHPTSHYVIILLSVPFGENDDQPPDPKFFDYEKNRAKNSVTDAPTAKPPAGAPTKSSPFDVLFEKPFNYGGSTGAGGPNAANAGPMAGPPMSRGPMTGAGPGPVPMEGPGPLDGPNRGPMTGGAVNVDPRRAGMMGMEQPFNPQQPQMPAQQPMAPPQQMQPGMPPPQQSQQQQQSQGGFFIALCNMDWNTDYKGVAQVWN